MAQTREDFYLQWGYYLPSGRDDYSQNTVEMLLGSRLRLEDPEEVQKLFVELKFLHLSDNNLGDVNMVTLASGLKQIEFLNTLDLSNNAIGDIGIESLADGFKNWRNYY
jgi:Ran GTPase-activating protein (RanGAP) involved in mRNA processing and transport